MTGTGLVAGLLTAAATAPRLGTLLFRTSPSDPLTYVVAALVLLLVAIVATYVPARRAGRADPNALLRL